MSLGMGLVGLVLCIIAVSILMAIIGDYILHGLNIYIAILMIIGDILLFAFGCRIMYVSEEIGD